jgi:ankyrin repeat protein
MGLFFFLLLIDADPINNPVRLAHAYSATGDLAKLEALLNANPKVVNAIWVPADGYTPLHTAARAGKVGAAELLLKHGADASGRDASDSGNQPIHMAAERGNKALVALFLRYKADINATTKLTLLTPLLLAARNGHRDLVAFLLRKGAKTDIGGVTPLHEAAMAGHIEVCRLLLQHKLDVNAKTRDGRTALFYSSYADHLEVAKLLVDHGATLDVFSAACLGYCDYLHAQLKADPKLVFKTFFYASRTLLDQAARSNQPKVARLLLKYGALPNWAPSDITPLHAAARSGHTKVIEVLLAAGAKVNPRDPDGLTPLHFAVKGNKLAAVQMLLANKADANSRDEHEETPLLLGISADVDAKIIDTLLRGGANPNLATSAGKSPLSSSRFSRNGKQYVPLLKKYGAKE